MPSWQARLASATARVIIRRHDWGDEWSLARRARRVFGAPVLLQRLALHGLDREDVRVGGVAGEWLTPAPPARGLILYVHGGGYVSCSSATHRPITAALARLTGHRVFAVDYRTAPESRFPAAFDDVAAAYKWLSMREAPGTPVAIAGESAGGGLVLALAQHARDSGWPAPACVTALSPLVDLATTRLAPGIDDGRCAMFRPENLPAFAAAYLGGSPATDPRASPVYGDFRGLPPVLVQVGSTELLRQGAERARDAIVRAGGTVTLTIYDDVPHGWQLLTPLVPEAREALAEVAAFINTHLDNETRAKTARPESDDLAR